MANVSQNPVSKPDYSRRFGRVFESIGKYAVDLAVNFSSKSDKGRGRLHKTVQEEIKDQSSLRPCNKSEKPAVIFGIQMQAKTEEMEGINSVKHKTEVTSQNMEVMSSKKVPPEQLKEKDFLLPNKKRIMIRSRL